MNYKTYFLLTFFLIMETNIPFHSGAHRSGSRDGGSGAAGEEPQAEALLVLAKLMLAARPHSP